MSDSKDYVSRCEELGNVHISEEVLAAIEAFEDNPPDPGPSVEERTAAALEFLAMNSLPDEQ